MTASEIIALIEENTASSKVVAPLFFRKTAAVFWFNEGPGKVQLEAANPLSKPHFTRD